MTTTYRYKHFTVRPSDALWRDVARNAYVMGEALYCGCQPQREAVPVCLAQAHGTYVAKRIPFTGPRHAPSCEHYQEPDGLSGRGPLIGAMRYDPQTSMLHVRLDAALHAALGSAAPTPARTSRRIRKDGATSKPDKFTLRALLHLLFDESGLSRWSPNMEGKRSWHVVRRELLRAAGDIMVRRRPLLDVLYIPETFDNNRAAAIGDERAKRLRRLWTPGARIIFIGEWKFADAVPGGLRVTFKHMPDAPMFMEHGLVEKLRTNNQDALRCLTKGSVEGARLLLIATISRAPDVGLQIESASAICVTKEWLPVSDVDDCRVVEHAVRVTCPQ
jgi:hypothetical protein